MFLGSYTYKTPTRHKSKKGAKKNSFVPSLFCFYMQLCMVSAPMMDVTAVSMALMTTLHFSLIFIIAV